MKRIVSVSIIDPFDNRYICGYNAPYQREWSLAGYYRKQALRLKWFAKHNDPLIGVRQPKIKVKVLKVD